MHKLKRVFVIEANMALISWWQLALRDKAQIIWADSPTMAENTLMGKFKEELPFDLMVVAPCIRNGPPPVVAELVRTICEGEYKFRGPIVACSDVVLWRDCLMEAGASHFATRQSLPGEVIKILGV